MSAARSYSGRCACGAIRYEITAEPAFVFICHCRDCQRATGSTQATNAWFPYGAVNYTGGEPKAHRVIGSFGNPVYHEFCQACGSSLGMRSETFPDFRAVRIASMDERDQFEPVAEVWTGSKIAWDPLHPTLPKHAAAMPEDDFLAIIGESQSLDPAENSDE